jgi:hypothetical protein
MDTRTFTSEARDFGRQMSLLETVEVLKRDMSTLILGGHAGWLLDWSGPGTRGVGNFTEPEVISTIKRGQEIYQKTLNTPHKSAAQIAVIVSGESYMYGDIYLNSMIYHQLIRRTMYNELPHIGAPYDIYRIEDLGNPVVQKQYKLYIFINSFALNSSNLKAIRELKRNGKTLLWFYASDYADQKNGLDTFGVSQVTGMRIATLNEKRVMNYHLTDAAHPIVQGQNMGKNLGVIGFGEALSDEMYTTAFNPIFYVDDPMAQTLATYDFGKPALAVRDFGTWKSVYCAVPYMDAELLRGVAKYAGVHLYTDIGPVVLANQNMLMIHSCFGGPATVDVH